jgi:hypothetical protein
MHEPIGNFALDLLLGKPCLVVTHHDDFRQGMAPLISLVNALNGLAPTLRWTNLEAIVSRTYSIRERSASVVDVRLLASATALEPWARDAEIAFSKAEPSQDKTLEVVVAGRAVNGRRQGGDVVFDSTVRAGEPIAVDVKIASPKTTWRAALPARYRVKVAARRYLSEIRDNYVARSPWATAAVTRLRGASRMAVESR